MCGVSDKQIVEKCKFYQSLLCLALTIRLRDTRDTYLSNSLVSITSLDLYFMFHHKLLVQ